MNGFILAISVLLLQVVLHSSATSENSKYDDQGGNVVGMCPTGHWYYHTLLAHKYDCGKFFICERGNPKPARCPGELHFNRRLMVCDYPEKAGCRSEDYSEETSESYGKSGSDSKEDNDYDQVVGKCPAVDGKYATLLPHKSDCTKFFHCNGGTPVVKTCYPGLYFNPKLMVCDYGYRSGCGKDEHGGKSSESIETPSKNSDQDYSDEDNHYGQEVGQCPKVDGEYVILLPHKSDCDRFFKCDRGNPVVKKCPPGLHFNPKLLVCDYPDQAGCRSKKCDDRYEDCNDGQVIGKCPKVDGKYLTVLPHKSDCNKFFVCYDGSPIVAKCNENLHFNPKSKACEYPERAGCEYQPKYN